MDLYVTNKQLFASQDINWWTFCNVFISRLNSRSDSLTVQLVVNDVFKHISASKQKLNRASVRGGLSIAMVTIVSIITISEVTYVSYTHGMSIYGIHSHF